MRGVSIQIRKKGEEVETALPLVIYVTDGTAEVRVSPWGGITKGWGRVY